MPQLVIPTNTKTTEMPKQSSPKSDHVVKAIDVALRLGFIGLLFAMSFLILKPFLAPVVWGVIIAVAVYPLHQRLTSALRGKAKLSAVIIALIGLSIIVVPSILFTNSTVDSIKSIAHSIESDSFKIPSPNESVKEWPLIGNQVYNIWEQTTENIAKTIQRFGPQLKSLIPKITGSLSAFIKNIFLFIISIIISAALLLVAEPGKKMADVIFKTLAGNKAEDLVHLSVATIRNVVQGIVGTAFIQTFFLSLGIFMIDIPAAGIISIIILILAVVQIPLIIVLAPLIIYVFSIETTTVAILFTIWSILWSLADNALKPILMGKGVDVPMLVILLGALGGMILSGPIGLFIGAVILTITYKILISLVTEEVEKEEEVADKKVEE